MDETRDFYVGVYLQITLVKPTVGERTIEIIIILLYLKR
jgi:hypothetical protein